MQKTYGLVEDKNSELYKDLRDYIELLDEVSEQDW